MPMRTSTRSNIRGFYIAREVFDLSLVPPSAKRGLGKGKVGKEHFLNVFAAAAIKNHAALQVAISLH